MTSASAMSRWRSLSRTKKVFDAHPENESESERASDTRERVDQCMRFRRFAGRRGVEGVGVRRAAARRRVGMPRVRARLPHGLMLVHSVPKGKARTRLPVLYSAEPLEGRGRGREQGLGHGGEHQPAVVLVGEEAPNALQGAGVHPRDPRARDADV